MKYDLAEFEKRVDSGLLRKAETDKLVLYTYTEKCTYERAWDDYTRAARGIIFEKSTGKLIAKPFDKFFNLGEMPETSVMNLPDVPYLVTEKMDGSLGIIYYYDNKWNMATKGSFSSEQAVKGLEIFHKKYSTKDLSSGLTYLVEIIYPENKIVVDYNEEKLVLLAAYDIHSGAEVSLSSPEHISGMPKAISYEYTIDQMAELCKTLPKDKEGFVVRFKGGLRVKIKGQEYLRIHKIISQLSPLSAWKSMENGVIRKDYLEQVPEEYLKGFQPIVDELETQYKKVLADIAWQSTKLPSLTDLKTIGLYLKVNPQFDHSGAMFPYVLSKKDAINKYIMKFIRPNGNILLKFETYSPIS